MTIQELPPFTPALQGFLLGEFHDQSVELLKFPVEQDQRVLNFAPFVIQIPPPPPEPLLPVLPFMWYPKPIQAVRDRALGLTLLPRLANLLGKVRLAETQRAMRTLLAGNGPVKIIGDMGVGKTTFLSHIANHERTRQRYRRVWWIDDPLHLPQTLALLLNQSQVLMEPDINQQMLTLRDALGDDTLLVVDNCTPADVAIFSTLTRHLLVAVQDIPPEAEEGETLPPDPDDVVTLRVLPPDDGFELLLHACGITDRNVLRGQMRAWLTHLVRLLNGHPLAIMITGALFREDGLPLEHVVEIFNARIESDHPDPTVALDISLAAMPTDYLAVLDAFALLPAVGCTQEALMAAAKIEDHLTCSRTLAFLMKHGMVERVGNYHVAHRAVWEKLSRNKNIDKKIIERIEHWVLGIARRYRDEPEQVYRFQREVLHAIDYGQQNRHSSFLQKINGSLGPYLYEYAPKYLTVEMPTPRLMGQRAHAAGKIAEGLRHIEQNDLEAAEATLKEGLTLSEAHASDHEHAEALVANARYCTLKGDYEAAVQLLEKAARLVYDLKAEKSLHLIRLGLAMVYRKQERHKDALGVLDDEPDTVLERVRIYRETRQWDLLLQTLAAADTIAPYVKAEAYLQARHYADALGALAEAQDSDSAFLRAIIYHLQHDYDNAIRGYEIAQDTISKQNPKRMNIMLTMAQAYVNKGDIPKARQVYYQSLDLFPMLKEASQALRGWAYGGLAALELMENNTEKALQLAEQALDAFSKTPPNTHHLARADVYRTMGRAYHRLGRVKPMLTAFEHEVNVAQASPSRNEARIGMALHHLGDAYRLNSEMDRAIANYRRALTHKDANHDAAGYFITQTALFLALFEEKRYGQALDVCQLALRHLSSTPPADLQFAGFMLANKARTEQELDNLDHAVRTIHQWMTLLAGRSDALHDERHGVRLLALSLAVRSLLHHNRPNDALAIAEEALKLAENYYAGTSIAWSVRRDLGHVLLKQSQWNAVIQTLAPLLRPEVAASKFTYALAHEYTAIAQGESGELQTAVRNLHIALEYHPIPHYQALLQEKMAGLHLKLNDAKSAIEHIQAAIPLLDREHRAGDAARVLTMLAQLLSGTNHYAEAVEVYEDALSMLRALPDADPVHTAQVYNSLAASHEAQGQFPQAAIAYRNALDTLENTRRPAHATHSETLTRLARVYVVMHDYNEAIALYLQARTETERYGTPQVLGLVIAGLADTYRQAERYEEALYAYEEALSIQPADQMPRERAATLRGYGQALAHLNQLSEARDAWTEALAITTDAPALEIALTHRAIAQAFSAQGLYGEAERAFNDALSYHQGNSDELALTLRLLGATLNDAHRFDESIPILQQSLDIEKGMAQQVNNRIVETLDLLAVAYEQCNDLAAAITSHHEALVYTDRHMQPLQTANRYRLLGRLYSVQARWKEAHKAYEESLAIEIAYKPRSDHRIAQTLEMIAQTYRREGSLQKAAEAYKRMAAYANLSKTADAELKQTLSEIERHEQTLEAARASLEVLLRNSESDLKDLVYVYALIAVSHAGLSQYPQSDLAIDKLLTLLESQAGQLSTLDERPTYRALAHVFEGSQAASAGDLMGARAHFQRALHDTTDNSMRWVIERGLESVRL